MLSKMWVLGAVLGAVGCGAPESPVESSEADVKSYQFCGGIAGFACPTGFECIDNPRDNCDPKKGGADCGGICVKRGKPSKCDYNEPGLHYVGTSAQQCQVIRFACTVGTSYFSNSCGCGCQDLPTCPIIDCAAPPAGCHYEGAVFTPCDQQSCGHLVCDGGGL